nr:PREDICTED: uncharacterized protein LOC106490469 [Apteryx mantelli mantelli]
MTELGNWVIQWGPNPWGPNSCKSIQQADQEFAKLKETTKSKLFSRKFLKCAGAWAVWLVAKSLAEEKQTAQAEIQNLKEENDKLKAEVKAQRVKLEEGKTREGVAAVEQVRSVLQYQEVCEQKKAIMNENQQLKERLAISTKAVEEVQGAIRVLVQNIQSLKEKGTDHRACEAKVEKLKAALGAKHGVVTALPKAPYGGDDEPWDRETWTDQGDNPSLEQHNAPSPYAVAFEAHERFKGNPVSPTTAQVTVKREAGGTEEGRRRGNVQPQGDRVIRRETTATDLTPYQLKQGSCKERNEQSGRSAWTREAGVVWGRANGSKGKRNPRERNDLEVMQTVASSNVTPQYSSSGKVARGRWQGKKQWQNSTTPQVVVRNNVARKELNTMRVDIWRQLRKQGEDMTRWDNAPTGVLLDRLLEISGRREESGPGAPVLPVIV